MAISLWERFQNDTTHTIQVRSKLAMLYGICLMQTGDQAGSLRMLQTAIEIDSSYEYPYINIGILKGNQRKHKEAMVFFDKALQLKADTPDAHFNRAIALRLTNHIDEAIESNHLAIKYGFNKPDAHKSLAALFWKRGEIGNAVDVYEDGLKIWPKDKEMRHWYDLGKKTMSAKMSD